MIELVREVSVELIEAAASDDMVAMAAWVSNDADSQEKLAEVNRVRNLISFLYKNKHMSPFEHGHFTFKVDVPLFVAREFHRHRTASYNEVSGRYTEMKPRFWVGNEARVQKGKMGNYHFETAEEEQTAIYFTSKNKVLKKAWKEYIRRLEAGIAKEQAREDLPLSLMTQFYVTMNPRNLMQFLTLRNDKHALKEIRDVAVKMEEIFAQHMPLTYAAYVNGREESAADSTDLIKQNKELNAKVEQLTGQLAYANSRYEYLYAENKDLLASKNNLIAEYNRKFVAEKEDAQAKDYQTGKFARGGPVVGGTNLIDIVNQGCDYIIPKAAAGVEKLAPVYNVYVNSKGNDSTIENVQKVVERLKRYNERKRT